MNIKKLGKCLAGGLIAVSTFYVASFGLNHLINNCEYKSKDGWYHTVKRADRAFGNTQYGQYRDRRYNADEVWISRSRFPKMLLSFYKDGGYWGPHDGLVDVIAIYESVIFKFRHSKEILLKRDKHFGSHRSEFEKADKILAQTKERFQKFFK